MKVPTHLKDISEDRLKILEKIFRPRFMYGGNRIKTKDDKVLDLTCLIGKIKK
tara:strand:+ start:1007 stop:1165 length:159 start_codon:yes stop_codon:yes gene_type:complete